MAAVGQCICKHKAGGGVGSAMSNGNGGRWWEVVAWPIQGDGGHGAVCSQTRGGWGPENPKSSCHGLVSGLPHHEEMEGGSVGSQNPSAMVI
jgi:hypothetical protein